MGLIHKKLEKNEKNSRNKFRSNTYEVRGERKKIQKRLGLMKKKIQKKFGSNTQEVREE